MFQTTLIFLLQLIVFSAHAGMWELGVNGNYRKAYMNADNTTDASALTGSIAFYFGTMSALEGSYTYGSAKTRLALKDRPNQTVTVFYEMIGLDLVITLTGQDSVIRPYIKGGGAYILKKDTFFAEDGRTAIMVTGQSGEDTGLVPSAGAGVKINLSRVLSLKLGVEGWSSTPRNAGLWDTMYRAGVSLLF